MKTYVDKDIQYLANHIKAVERKISTLMIIVNVTKNSLDDEVTQTKKTLKDGMDTKVLLDDILDTMEYKYDDLEVFEDIMYDILSKLRIFADEIVDKKG